MTLEVSIASILAESHFETAPLTGLVVSHQIGFYFAEKTGLDTPYDAEALESHLKEVRSSNHNKASHVLTSLYSI